MSRGQLARTPENFPRMKYRAAHRHHRRQALIDIGPAIATLRHLAATLPAALEAMAKSINRSMLQLSTAARTALAAAPRRPWFLALDQAEARGAWGRTGL